MLRIAALCLTLAACNRGPEVPTPEENRDLDEAAEMLDKADENLSAIDPANLQSTNPEPRM